MKRLMWIFAICMVMAVQTIEASTGQRGETWRYDIISGDAIIATAGSRFWMIQTGADYRMFGQWAGGVRCLYWEQHLAEFKNVYAIDNHLTYQIFHQPSKQWDLLIGMGVKGSTCNYIENAMQVSMDFGTTIDFEILPKLFMSARGTWMVFKDGFVAPFWVGMQMRFTPEMWLGAGVAGVQSKSFLSQQEFCWEMAPAIRLSIRI